MVDVVPLDDVIEVIERYHLCVVKNCRLSSFTISKASQMKIIMQFGVGLEGVDIDAASNHGIKVARIPGNMTGNSLSCAEMAIYLMLGLLRKQKEMDAAVRDSNLGFPTGETLFGKTVFILGFGAIGFDLAKRLRPFGVKVIATKRRWGDNGYDEEDIGDLVDEKGFHDDREEFAAKADIVVPCLRLDSKTVRIVDLNFISNMKKGALLVNVARGGLLDYTAVFDGLESGRLGGLGMDVAWEEPFDPHDPILNFPNVLLTPHVSGVTEYSYRNMAKIVGDVAIQLHNGDPLTGVEFVN